MTGIVNEIKDQFARIIEPTDWSYLLEIADYHFETAAKLKKRNIRYTKKQLLIRNSMKRLHLGIGVELALKSAFLKKGICVNKFVNGFDDLEKSPIHNLSTLDRDNINPKNTYTLDALINKYAQVFSIDVEKEFLDGLRIAMTFRNKEGHVSFPNHEFHDSNYTAIASSVIKLYKDVFSRNLEFKIAMRARDKGIFKNKTNQFR
jgi:hypothetical protein